MSQTKNNFIRTPTPLFQSGSTSGGIHTEERKGRNNLFLFNRTTLKKKTNLAEIFTTVFAGAYYPFLGTVATSGVFSFFFSNRAQASKHSGTKTSSGFPPLADQ